MSIKSVARTVFTPVVSVCDHALSTLVAHAEFGATDQQAIKAALKDVWTGFSNKIKSVLADSAN